MIDRRVVLNENESWKKADGDDAEKKAEKQPRKRTKTKEDDEKKKNPSSRQLTATERKSLSEIDKVKLISFVHQNVTNGVDLVSDLFPERVEIWKHLQSTN